MSRFYPKTSIQDRVTWLRNNPDMWRGIDFEDDAKMMALAQVMRMRGLYSDRTYLGDIVRSLGPLIDGARDSLDAPG